MDRLRRILLRRGHVRMALVAAASALLVGTGAKCDPKWTSFCAHNPNLCHAFRAVGSWDDGLGNKGTMNLNVDASKTTARSLSVTFSGPFLGSGGGYGGSQPVSPTETSGGGATFVAPHLGRVVFAWEDPSLGVFDLTIDRIPGHPEIDSIQASFSVAAGEARYHIRRRDGKVVVGVIAFSTGAVRPPAPSAEDALRLDITTGVYACELVTAKEARKIAGQRVVVYANGGRLNYAPGVDVSNCWYVRPQDVKNGAVRNGPLLDYAVYRARNRKAAKAFFASARKRISPSLLSPAPKLGDAAFESGRLGSGTSAQLWVLAGSQVLEANTPSLTGVKAARAKAIVLAAAKKIVPRLR